MMNKPGSKLDMQPVIHHGDANEFIKRMPDGSVDLVMTSPPYNIGKKYEKRLSLEEYLENQARLISQLYRVLKSNGSICWQVGNYVENGEIYPLDILYYPVFKKLGMKLRNRIIWKFGHGLHAKKRLSGRYETILWFTKSDDYTFNLDAVRVPAKYPNKRHFKGPKKGELSCHPLGKNPSDIWEILVKDWEEGVWNIPNVKSNHPEKTIHPCQFPIELAERCILALTNKGETVFDPYMGVGSTLVAALMNGRRAIGCEREIDYVQVARQRMEDLFNDRIRYRALGKPIYQHLAADVLERIRKGEEPVHSSEDVRKALGLDD